MITFTSLGGATINVAHKNGNLIVFGDDSHKPDDKTRVLYGTPKDEPAEKTLSWPGEYDYDGAAIRGIGHEEGKAVSYGILIDGVRIAFLCSPLRDWTDHELELLGDVDILFIPTDDPKILQKLIDEIDPRVLIPTDTGGSDKHAECMKICGAQGAEPQKEYVVKSSLPAEGRATIVLEN